MCPDLGYEIEIERCVLPEVQALWDMGIVTYCSCCGHSVDSGYTVVGEADKQRMLDLGYELKTDHHKCKHINNAVAFKAKHSFDEQAKLPVTNEKFLVWQHEGDVD